MPPASFTLRTAVAADTPAIEALIERSVQALQAADYTQAQRDGALGLVFLVDHGLIADGTYLVAETPDGRLTGAGGWSDRRARHGGEMHGDTGERVDSAAEPARIRAYFVDPSFARQGVGSAILAACEAAAVSAGFTRATLGATLTGVPFYARHGYVVERREQVRLPGSEEIEVVHMSRRIA